MVSCLRRLVNSAACVTMMDSDSSSISLCHEVDTRAAFACVRFACSIARSLSKCRPVVRTGSISQGAGRGCHESTFMPLDFAIVARRCRSVLGVFCALSNAIPEPRCFSIVRTDNSHGSDALSSLVRSFGRRFCRWIQGGPDLRRSATRVTGELWIADVRHGA